MTGHIVVMCLALIAVGTVVVVETIIDAIKK